MALNKHMVSALSLAAILMGSVAQASTAKIHVQFTNNAEAGGTIQTPVWTAFHDGGFNTFTTGQAASMGLERLAEDGNTQYLSDEFHASASAMNGGVDGVLAGVVAPGLTSDGFFHLSTDGSNRYFSYASMLLPSSDFFIANGNPQAFDLSELLDGVVSTLSFDVFRVYDAGTEVNDFGTAPTPPNSARGISGGQTGPNQGVDENGVVTFIGAAGSSAPESFDGLNAFLAFQGIAGLPDQLFQDLNFTGYDSIGTFTFTNVSQVPVPGAALLFGPALLGFLGLRRRNTNAAA